METLKDVEKYLNDHKGDADVIKFLEDKSKLSPEQKENYISEWKSSTDGKRDIQSTVDKDLQKAIDTWKDNNVSKIEDEIKEKVLLELNPPKDPISVAHEKRIAELENMNKEIEGRAKKAELNTGGLSYADEKGISKHFHDIIKLVIGEDEENTNSNIDRLSGAIDLEIKDLMKEHHIDIGREAPEGNGKGVAGKTVTEDQLNQMPPKERAAFFADGGSIKEVN